MRLPATLIRHLRRAREVLSEIMADEAQAAHVREVAKQCGLEVNATGGLVIRTKEGGVLGYFAEMSCDELDALLAFGGALKADARRPGPEAPRSCPW